METDWSVAAGADDPLIEIPWRDAAMGLEFTDLRVNAVTQTDRIAGLPETADSSALARVLALLNRRTGLLMTSKCDRWLLDDEERAELAEILDTPIAAHGCGSYIDVLMTHPIPMADLLLHEEWARATTRRSATLAHPEARLDLIIRPAQFHTVWGYGMTVYHYAAGSDPRRAQDAWTAALEETVAILIEVADASVVRAGSL